MALKIASRTAQYTLQAEFTWNYNDTMLDTTGALKDFKTTGTSIVADVIPLPPNATVVSGSVTTDTAVTGSTAYNVSVGDSGSATRYLGATDRKAAGTTALVPTGYIGTGQNIRLTVAPTVADATLGTLTLRVAYVVRGRAQETMIA